MSAPKDVILLIDGTRQGPEKPTSIPTNVECLAYFLNAEPLRSPDIYPRAPNDRSGLRVPKSSAVVGYISGVGADTPPGFDLFPGATGHGMADTIRLAYRFLLARYQPSDRIFLFGFSRGAFAVRSLAGFVDCVGVGLRVVPEDSLDLAIDEAYFAYEFLEGDTKALRTGINEYLHEYLKGSTHDTRERAFEFESLPIYLIGIWDAVEALGLPSKASAVTRVFNSYHQTILPPNVSHAYHALALHELRSDFEPHVWTNKDRDEQVLEQRWFAGDHSDIGGGHTGRQLADVSLEWMLRCVEQAGFASVHPLAQYAAQKAALADIQQRWQDIIYCVLPPKARQILQNYDRDLNIEPLLGGSFDPTVTNRLSSGQEIDYSRFRIGFGKTFGVRSHDLQIGALRQVDQCTIRGLLRKDPRFQSLTAARQEKLLHAETFVDWADAVKQLLAQSGEQAADQMHQGLSKGISVGKSLADGLIKKNIDGERP
ncbi:DUF2235 domain-containing protein [Terriglobus sp. 2YAB30_2]|uniref:phospholipase effector Tle1 domain-containing protein n=1 Tax=unclassified Terriglobus TaxID=2628988 RepID=UPI003F9CAF2A